MFSYDFFALWILGLGSGVYMAFFTSPKFNLDGLWYGILAGTGSLTCLLIVIVITINWEKETNKMILRYDMKKMNDLELNAIPKSCNRGIGSFQISLLFNNQEEKELYELEALEFGFNKDKYHLVENA